MSRASEVETQLGYFIESMRVGGVHGPLKEPSLGVTLVYGTPALPDEYFDSLDIVSKRLREYDLLRYFKHMNEIYVVRYDPNHVIRRFQDEAIAIPATEKLHKVFDVYLPEWLSKRETFFESGWRIFRKAVEKARKDGNKELTWEYADTLLNEDIAKGSDRYKKEFYDIVVKYIDEFPQPPLVRVEGIDDILDKIEIKRAS